MNSLKNILVVTVLLGVGYAVYTTLNSQPGSSPAPEQADGWPTAVDVQMPNGSDSKSAAPKNPFAARGDQTAERVPARNANAFDSSRTASDRSAPVRSPLGTAERSSSARVPSGNVPGEAMSTDLPSYGPSGPNSTPRAKRESEGPTAGSAVGRPEFVAMMQAAEKRLGMGELAQVHQELSRLYGDQVLTAEESRQLTGLLDQLAGTVIYSRKHLLEPAYTVKPGDSLQSIAQSYNVPWQLLAKINAVRDPQRLQPGTQLKVVRGPFEVVVSLERFELTLLLGGRYAGRFPIGVGRDIPQLEGSFTVRKKVVQPASQGPDRSPAAGNPNSPQGQIAIELADRIAIHGTNDIRNLRRADGPGTICLGPRDIEDLCDILTANSEAAIASTVTIRR